MRTALWRALLTFSCLTMPLGAQAETPRDVLTSVAFTAGDKATALARIENAKANAEAALKRAPRDREAHMILAMATGYRAKLTRSRADALSARAQFEALVASNPNDPEAQAALAGWHIDAVAALGGFTARMALGARREAGFAALDRAVTLGGDRAMFTGLAALLRLELDRADPLARPLAERASRGTTPTPLDRAMNRAALAVLPPLRAGKVSTARAVAIQWLPLGRIAR